MSVVPQVASGLSKLKKKHFRVKHQKVKLFRANEPLLSVFMWGVNHTVSPRAISPRPRVASSERHRRRHRRSSIFICVSLVASLSVKRNNVIHAGPTSASSIRLIP